MVLHGKVYGYDYKNYVILGDGVFQEGMVWEACLTIPNKKLNNICGFIDYNRLQVDGCTDDINQLDPLDEKLKAFNWDVRVIDGHDFYAIIDSLDYFKRTRNQNDKPLMIISNTIKGKGASEIEGVCYYHAVPLSLDEYERAERECLGKIELLEKKASEQGPVAMKVKSLVKTQPEEKQQDLSEIIRRNYYQPYNEATATRIGYGNALARLGKYEKVLEEQ